MNAIWDTHGATPFCEASRSPEASLIWSSICRAPVKLIAPVANLVASSELHDAFIPLFLEAATKTHHAGGLLTNAGEHPSLDGVEFPVNEVARQYLTFGPSFFQKHLSFWFASLIDRAKIMLLPMLILLIPLAKLAPPVYRWRIRSRIYRWYAILNKIDQTLREGDDERLKRHEKKLTDMERELQQVQRAPFVYGRVLQLAAAHRSGQKTTGQSTGGEGNVAA